MFELKFQYIFYVKMDCSKIYVHIIVVLPTKQKRDICTAFPAAVLSSSLSSSA